MLAKKARAAISLEPQVLSFVYFALALALLSGHCVHCDGSAAVARDRFYRMRARALSFARHALCADHRRTRASARPVRFIGTRPGTRGVCMRPRAPPNGDAFGGAIVAREPSGGEP